MSESPIPNNEQRRAVCELLSAVFIYMRQASEAECQALADVLHNLPVEIYGTGAWDVDLTCRRLRRFQQDFYKQPSWGLDFAGMLERIFAVQELPQAALNPTNQIGEPAVDPLDDLLIDEEPHATFHDAFMLNVHVDYETQTFAADFDVCVGDPDASDESRERRRRGTLVVDGLSIWSLEPPGEGAHDTAPGLWLTAIDQLCVCPTAVGRELRRNLLPGEVGWYLYFSDLNAHAYLAGKMAEFRWFPP